EATEGFPKTTTYPLIPCMCMAESPVSCYKIEPGTVAGIISVDIILTLLIVAVTYHCARNQQQRATKVYMNVRAKCKT
uniref:Hematopoietic cell signal transducer n=1 Tax=Periophthalmus magnuspinnatus TaxID=409849 RepID=A0A3B3ZM07_9GOBI